MNQQLIDSVVHAVHNEGPDKTRFMRGRAYPEIHDGAQKWAEPCAMQTECLVEGPGSARLEIIARFLQPAEREIGALAAPLHELPALDNPDFFHIVPALEVEGRLYEAGREAIERVIETPVLTLGELGACPQTVPFSFAATRAIEPILDPRGRIAGVVVRRQEAIEGVLEISAETLEAPLVKVAVRIVNRSPVPAIGYRDADEIMMRTFASTHTILHTHGGEFVSLIDPPEAWAQAAAACQNLGTWPILVGDEHTKERDTLLSSPVLLDDYPKIAAQDPDEILDAGEIEEDVTLHITAMTREERRTTRLVARQVSARRVIPFSFAVK